MTYLHWIHNFSFFRFVFNYMHVSKYGLLVFKLVFKGLHVSPVWKCAKCLLVTEYWTFSSGRLSPASQGGTMSSLSSLWLYAALPGLLLASHVSLMVEGDNDASRICKSAPKWTIKGQSPMQELLGNVVVVALLKASWQFCLTQASK